MLPGQRRRVELMSFPSWQTNREETQSGEDEVCSCNHEVTIMQMMCCVAIGVEHWSMMTWSHLGDHRYAVE